MEVRINSNAEIVHKPATNLLGGGLFSFSQFKSEWTFYRYYFLLGVLLECALGLNSSARSIQ